MPADGATIEVGAAAPDFSLESSEGNVVELSDYRGQRLVVLYFMREFSCMQCQAHAIQLGHLYDQLKTYDTAVLTIGGGDSRAARRTAMMLRLPFPVLADPDRQTYLRYGFDRVLFFIQRSGTFLIDKAGIIRYIHQVTNPGASLDKAALMQAVTGL